MSAGDAALKMEGITKSFGPINALRDVSIEVRRGEIHGLIGANGSGKSTVVKTLSGIHAPESGSIAVWGRQLSLPVSGTGEHGMAVIHQDLGLAEHLSVMENVVASTNFGAGRMRIISWRAQHERVLSLLERLDISVDPKRQVGELSRGNRTLVAVARAICEMEVTGGTDHLLITDEPTSALPKSEASALWNLLRRVVVAGGSALFISHHLDEVLSLCDRVTVLRDGEIVSTAMCVGLTEDGLVEMMVGKGGSNSSAKRHLGRAAPVDAAPVLQVRSLSGVGLHQLDLTIQAGEVLGITGLLGMGQDAVPEAVAGVRGQLGGRLHIDGLQLPLGDPARARKAGVVLVPAERQRDGLWLDGTIAENIGMVRTRELARRGYYDRVCERARAASLAERFDVRPRDVRRPVRDLSGGNQQKVMLAKWLQLDPRVVLLHEPTQGVDVAATLDIYRLIREYATLNGAAVLIVSSDHDEVATHCDRILVMAHGRFAGEVSPVDFTPERFMSLASVAR